MTQVLECFTDFTTNLVHIEWSFVGFVGLFVNRNGIFQRSFKFP